MIDISSEHLVTLTNACELLPCRRRGKKPHAATLYRWATDGVRGICLESIVVGATRCTSVEAIQRFFDRLTEQRDRGRQTAPASARPSTVTRRREIDEGENELEQANTEE